MPISHRQTKTQATSDRSQSASLRKRSSRVLAAQVLQRAQSAPSSLSHADVLTLQRSIGNQATARLLRPVLATSGNPIAAQRRTSAAESAQASPGHGLAGGKVDGGVERSIQQARGGGQQMGPRVQRYMEEAMGADFNGVRLHTDARANTLNRSLNAKAFTVGKDIFFSKGQYQPNSSNGQELLAHELTHTVQQGASGVQAQRKDGQPVSALANDSSTGETIQRRIGFEIETGLPVMHEEEEDTKFGGLDNDDLEAPFPGGKLMVDHLPNHEQTESEPFEQWNIIEFVTNPIADDLPDNEFEDEANTWIDSLVELRDFARDGFDYIEYAPHVGAPKYSGIVIGRPDASRAQYPAARWNRVGPQATMGIQLGKVNTAFQNTDAGRNWAGTTKHSRVAEGAHKAGPAADKIINKLKAKFPPTNNRDAGVDNLRGFLTLVLNYLLSGKATGTAGYIKNRSTFMYKSKLSSVRNQIIGEYYAGKILSRYPKRRQALRNMLLSESGLRRNDEVYKGATFPSDSKNLVRAGVWLDEVLAGTEDRLFEAMRNPWSNEIAPEDVHGERGAVMEMRDFKENQINTDNISLAQPDDVVNVLLQVYRLNRQWATG